MQDPTLYSHIKAQVQNPQSQFPDQEHLKCPRCDSTNTKFCYYNNYNLSQPRHFCKNCRRYWTKGGALRNIPVGGGSRKNAKRSSSSTSASSKRQAAASSNRTDGKTTSGETNDIVVRKDDNFVGQFGNMMDASGSFSQLLGSSGGHFGNLFDGLNGSSLPINEPFCDLGSSRNLVPQLGLENGSSNNADEFLNIQNVEEGGEAGCWSGSSNGWPDLAIYRPGSTFQ